MLILTRRQNQNLLFPHLGIKISVLRTAGNVVKLGIDAPQDVQVLREEIASALTRVESLKQPTVHGMSREERHAFRDRLNTAMLGLQVLQQRLECGQTDDLESLIYRIFNNLQDLNSQLDAQKKQARGAETAKRHPRALIVEDNVNEGQLLAEFLRFSGYDTQVVANGLEAIAYLQQHEHPDIVLMDMNMPEMNGAATIRTIRGEPALQHLRLYGVSGMDRDEAGVEVGEGGVDRWYTKPVDARLLIKELNRELEEELASA